MAGVDHFVGHQWVVLVFFLYDGIAAHSLEEQAEEVGERDVFIADQIGPARLATATS